MKRTRETVKRNKQENQLITSVSHNSPNCFFKSNKAISPVVAIALLLVVAVVAVVGFQVWFNTYSSSLFSDVEGQSSSGTFNTMIKTVIGSSLYFNNGFSNLTITDIKVDGTSCNISGSYGSGLTEIDLGNCTLNAITSVPEVVIYTDEGIFSKKIFLKDSSSDSGSGTASLDCSVLNGGEWILVPGNPTLGTEDFCVMKYEAKATTASLSNLFDPVNMYCGDGTDGGGGTRCPTTGSVNITSSYLYRPLTRVYQIEARQLCENLGTGYSLVTDPQWVTIARNAENNSINWFGGTIGTNFMFSGHNDWGMDDGINNAVSLNSSSSDADGYYRTGDSLSGCDGSSNNAINGAADDTTSGPACAGQRRTLTLSNGEVIWDLGGNVWEWTNNTFITADSDLGQASSDWYEWTAISGYNYLEPFNSSFDANYGVGRALADFDEPSPASDDPVHGFLRGGDWFHGAYAGAFALDLNVGPSNSNQFRGFRCSYAP
jgi:formylglycine-generating enzyme required for sulfatase activity